MRHIIEMLFSLLNTNFSWHRSNMNTYYKSLDKLLTYWSCIQKLQSKYVFLSHRMFARTAHTLARQVARAGTRAYSDAPMAFTFASQSQVTTSPSVSLVGTTNLLVIIVSFCYNGCLLNASCHKCFVIFSCIICIHGWVIYQLLFPYFFSKALLYI